MKGDLCCLDTGEEGKSARLARMWGGAWNKKPGCLQGGSRQQNPQLLLGARQALNRTLTNLLAAAGCCQHPHTTLPVLASGARSVGLLSKCLGGDGGQERAAGGSRSWRRMGSRRDPAGIAVLAPKPSLLPAAATGCP